MATCVPVRDMKDTAKFSETVRNADGPVTVTKNGRDEFVVMTSDVYEGIKQELARMKLYDIVFQAERELAEGKYSDYDTFSRELREKYGL